MSIRELCASVYVRACLFAARFKRANHFHRRNVRRRGPKIEREAQVKVGTTELDIADTCARSPHPASRSPSTITLRGV